MYSAQTTVETPKASRYLKALCNHFNRKVTAEYSDTTGNVQFGFADCQMEADNQKLVIHIQAESEENFGRVKFVVTDHLVRFANNEDVAVVWVDQE